LSFAGVVSCESIRIALTYTALLGLPVIGGDIQNAYLQAPSSEKHFIVCGPEFGAENFGRVALIRRALYGGKVAGKDFWHHLRDSLFASPSLSVYLSPSHFHLELLTDRKCPFGIVDRQDRT
jgi:hypothetical protein